MSCACQSGRRRPPDPSRRVLARVDSAVVSGGTFTSPALFAHERHNRWRVWVSLDGAPTAGDVTVLHQLEDPESPGTYRASQLATIPFDADGGTAGGELAPIARQLLIRLDGYTGGPGQTFIITLETWRESLA